MKNLSGDTVACVEIHYKLHKVTGHAMDPCSSARTPPSIVKSAIRTRWLANPNRGFGHFPHSFYSFRISCSLSHCKHKAVSLSTEWRRKTHPPRHKPPLHLKNSQRKSQTTSIIGIPISTRNPPLSRSRIPVNCLVFAGYWNASFTHKASRITFLLGYLGCSNCTPTVTLLRLAFSISL